ncbi:elongation factor Ts [Vibrio ponticus]|uniref:Elongation factor Ts n=1 Tax=Vibrio ponticus TaxID=265668 RepID=A0A3N3DSR8_9VIBR|nr:elongation factor Ts [Vibrio ponticus]ROV57547.1 elongation factor Ts [Vibrio ponticus]
MGTAKKQKQIQNALDALGWSHRQFADVLYEELNDNNDFKETDKDDIRKLGQNIKKQLQRDSTPEERLNQYLQILSEHPDYQALNLGNILPTYVPHRGIDEGLALQLTQLSSELDVFDKDKKDR